MLCHYLFLFAQKTVNKSHGFSISVSVVCRMLVLDIKLRLLAVVLLRLHYSALLSGSASVIVGSFGD